MKKKFTAVRFSLPAAAIVVLTSTLIAGFAELDWPQWRGASRDGSSAETGLLQSWPDGGPPLLWRASGMGTGFSSVSLSGDRIFTMGDLEDGQYVLALDLKNGQRVWKAKLGPRWVDQYGGPRGTPTLNGDRVYAIGSEGDLVCLNSSDGREVWRKSLTRDFGGKMMSIWKFAESPLVDGDRLIVTPGAKDAAMVALNKETGAEIWRAAVPNLGSNGKDGAAYSSAVISEGGGVRQYVQLMGRGLVGVEATTGRFLWGYNRVANNVANIATPLVSGDYVFGTTGYGTGSVLLRLSKDGAGVKAEEVYFLAARTVQNHHGGLILRDGFIYTGTGHNKGFPICLEMETGRVAWGPVRNKGRGSAAIAYADGRIYLRYQNGLMILAEATPEEYREKGSFMIPDVSAPSWPHPVIAGKTLYLREQDNLFAYDVSG